MKGLAYIRNLYGKSLNDIATALGVSNQVVSAWEKKQRIPDKRVKELAAYFGLDAEYFDSEITQQQMDEIQYAKWQMDAYDNGFLSDGSQNDTNSLDYQYLLQRMEKCIADPQKVPLIKKFFSILDSHSPQYLDLLFKSVAKADNPEDIANDDLFVSIIAAALQAWVEDRKKEQQLHAFISNDSELQELY